MVKSLQVSFVLFAIFFATNAYAETKIEKYQNQVANNLIKLSTDELVWIRAYNNTYNNFCERHNTSKVYNFFYEIASKTIMNELNDRDDLTTVWQTKYGYRKGLLKSLKGRIGNDGYCNCIYNHIIKGNSACLNQ